MIKNKVYVIIFLVIFCFVVNSFSQGNDITLNSIRINQEPVLDGDLSEPYWQGRPVVDDYFYTYKPTFGERLKYKTKVWIANDSENLYFAFYCYDNHPDKIRSTVARRDSVTNDDLIGVGIDLLGNRQSHIEFYSNPSGVQLDIHVSTTTGSDLTPDYVFYNGAKMQNDGYSVEIKIPLRNYKYISGKNVKMHVFFLRKVTGLSASGGWPEIHQGLNEAIDMATLIIDELEDSTSLSILPSITYGSLWDRRSPDEWSSEGGDTQVGLYAKYGLTSTITAEVTYNPDFSQIESDEFQVVVNQRYPVFYTEKRPFFMETIKTFSLAGTGDADAYNLKSAVHTRNIIDPQWGAKLHGNTGRLEFSFLYALDEWQEDSFTGREDSEYLIGRMRYNLSDDNYIGVLLSRKGSGEETNLVLGGDFLYFINSQNSLCGFYLHTQTDIPGSNDPQTGDAWAINYELKTKPFEFYIAHEYFAPEFRMDTAFLNRIGIQKYNYYMAYNIYPESVDDSFYKMISLISYGNFYHDEITGEDDYDNTFSLGVTLDLYTYLELSYKYFKEFWEGYNLEGDLYSIYGETTPSKWLQLSGYIGFGDMPYYAGSDSCTGDGLEASMSLTVEPTANLYQYFQYLYQKLDEPVSDDKLYDVNIFLSKTRYQINKYLFVRAIVQYDSYLENVLSDFLISFTYIPGTVIHLGYGSLHEKTEYKDDQWNYPSNAGQYYQVSQSVFFKVSYLFQI